MKVLPFYINLFTYLMKVGNKISNLRYDHNHTIRKAQTFFYFFILVINKIPTLVSFKQFSIAYITIGAKSNAPFQNLLFSYINFLTLYFFSIYFFSLSTNKVNKQTKKKKKIQT